jgi:guanylate kinase
MLVLSSPSGAGKTTISRNLLRVEPQLRLSVSATTRPKRPSEVDGVDYRFVDTATFQAMIRRDEFLEHAFVFGHHYGTPRGPVEKDLAAGIDVLFDIDWQGTQQLAKNEMTRRDLVSIFILPPSTQELESRLRRRAEDPDEVVQARMAKAADEVSHYDEYDFVIINDDVQTSVDTVQTILAAERQRRHRIVGLSEFVESLGAPRN